MGLFYTRQEERISAIKAFSYTPEEAAEILSVSGSGKSFSPVEIERICAETDRQYRISLRKIDFVKIVWWEDNLYTTIKNLPKNHDVIAIREANNGRAPHYWILKPNIYILAERLEIAAEKIEAIIKKHRLKKIEILQQQILLNEEM